MGPLLLNMNGGVLKGNSLDLHRGRGRYFFVNEMQDLSMSTINEPLARLFTTRVSLQHGGF